MRCVSSSVFTRQMFDFSSDITYPRLALTSLHSLRLGLGGAWIGLTVQHCGNHGAMSTRAWVNKALGLCDDLIGGSSLMWRYHHQVCRTQPVFAGSHPEL